jgi:hypothetical protein
MCKQTKYFPKMVFTHRDLPQTMAAREQTSGKFQLPRLRIINDNQAIDTCRTNVHAF